METKEKRNSGLVVVIILLVVALLGSVGYIVYDKVLSKDKESAVTDKDIETKKENERENISTSKISIYKDDILSQNTKISSELIGRYINKNANEEYMEFLSDNTFSIQMGNGNGFIEYTQDNSKISFHFFQKTTLTSLNDKYDYVLIEIKPLSSDYESYNILGKLNWNTGKYDFAHIENSPISNAMEFVINLSK